MSHFEKFLPNENNRRMFPGFLAFCIAAIGVALGFAASALSYRWLSIVAFFITASGVFGGIVCVIRGQIAFFRGDWRKEHQAYLDGLKTKQPWE